MSDKSESAKITVTVEMLVEDIHADLLVGDVEITGSFKTEFMPEPNIVYKVNDLRTPQDEDGVEGTDVEGIVEMAQVYMNDVIKKIFEVARSEPPSQPEE